MKRRRADTRRQADLALLLATRCGAQLRRGESASRSTPVRVLTVRFGIRGPFSLARALAYARPAGRELWGGALLGVLVAVGFVRRPGARDHTPSRAFIVRVSSVLAPVIALALWRAPRWLTAGLRSPLRTLGIYLPPRRRRGLESGRPAGR